jgi:hypothetical protein
MEEHGGRGGIAIISILIQTVARSMSRSEWDRELNGALYLLNVVYENIPSG